MQGNKPPKLRVIVFVGVLILVAGAYAWVYSVRSALRHLALRDNALVGDILDATNSHNMTIGEFAQKCADNVKSREEIISDLKMRDDWLYRGQSAKYCELLSAENEYVRALLHETLSLNRTLDAIDALDAAERPYRASCENRNATYAWVVQFQAENERYQAAKAEYESANHEHMEAENNRDTAHSAWLRLQSQCRHALSVFPLPPSKLPRGR